MSTDDDRWVKLGPGELLGIEDELNHFNDHAPYGLEHRRQRDITVNFEVKDPEVVRLLLGINTEMSYDFSSLDRFFKPRPHLY